MKNGFSNWSFKKMFRPVFTKGQFIATAVGVVLLAGIVVVPPCNDVCAYATKDNLKTYRLAGFRPWWQIGREHFTHAQNSEYTEIDWSLWLLELAALVALTSSAVVVSGRQP